MTDEASPHAFASRMRYWLARKGWTQQQLAKRSGVSLATISYLCRGTGGVPHMRTIHKIAKAFRITPEQLFEEFATTTPLAAEYQTLLRLFMRTSKTQQLIVMRLLREFAGRAAKKGSK